VTDRHFDWANVAIGLIGLIIAAIGVWAALDPNGAKAFFRLGRVAEPSPEPTVSPSATAVPPSTVDPSAELEERIHKLQRARMQEFIVKRVAVEQQLRVASDEPRSYRRIGITNYCGFVVRVALRYLSLDDRWITTGWYTLGENQSIEPREVTKGTRLCYYARDDSGDAIPLAENDGAYEFDVSDESFMVIESEKLDMPDVEVVRFSCIGAEGESDAVNLALCREASDQ
jgi:hypothetical protein